MKLCIHLYVSLNYLREMKTYAHENTYMQIIIAALFINSKNYK